MYLGKLATPVLCASLILTGCARSAPELPQEYAPTNDMDLSTQYENLPATIKFADCQQLTRELNALNRLDKRYESAIHANRGKNQTVGYLGAVLFPPALFALENDDVAKNNLARNQRLRDQIYVAQRAKNCANTTETWN